MLSIFAPSPSLQTAASSDALKLALLSDKHSPHQARSIAPQDREPTRDRASASKVSAEQAAPLLVWPPLTSRAGLPPTKGKLQLSTVFSSNRIFPLNKSQQVFKLQLLAKMRSSLVFSVALALASLPNALAAVKEAPLDENGVPKRNILGYVPSQAVAVAAAACFAILFVALLVRWFKYRFNRMLYLVSHFLLVFFCAYLLSVYAGAHLPAWIAAAAGSRARATQNETRADFEPSIPFCFLLLRSSDVSPTRLVWVSGTRFTMTPTCVPFFWPLLAFVSCSFVRSDPTRL